MDFSAKEEMELQFAKTPLQIKLEMKRKELEEKKKQLYNIQKTFIKIKSKQPAHRKVNSTEAISVAFNQMQKFSKFYFV